MPAGAINLGVAGHITAAALGRPRYDPSLTAPQRRCIDNGLWLCQVCGKLVDSDVSRFTADELRQWRAAAEAAASRELGKPVGARSHFAILEHTLTGHTNYIWDVVVTPDGRRAISASNDRTAALWDLANDLRLCVYRGAETEVCSVAISADGGRVAGGCLNGDVLVWAVHRPEPLVRFSHGASDAKVAWLGGSIISGGQDGYLRLWTNDRLRQEDLVHEAAILKVAPLGSGAIATASEDTTIRVWALRDRRQLRKFTGHCGGVNSVAIADGVQGRCEWFNGRHRSGLGSRSWPPGACFRGSQRSRVAGRGGC